MAANVHINGDVVEDVDYGFEKPVGPLVISVGTGVSFGISFNGGADYLNVPPGIHNLHVGPLKEITITADGTWGIVAVQA